LAPIAFKNGFDADEPVMYTGFGRVEQSGFVCALAGSAVQSIEAAPANVGSAEVTDKRMFILIRNVPSCAPATSLKAKAQADSSRTGGQVFVECVTFE
jgi:hypothetical protein